MCNSSCQFREGRRFFYVLVHTSHSAFITFVFFTFCIKADLSSASFLSIETLICPWTVKIKHTTKLFFLSRCATTIRAVKPAQNDADTNSFDWKRHAPAKRSNKLIDRRCRYSIIDRLSPMHEITLKCQKAIKPVCDPLY